MTNTIIDFIRLPVDENGVMIYDFDQAYQMFEGWQKLFPDHQAFMMPANITVWQDLDITSLKSIRQYLDEIIAVKEKENNDL